MGAIVRTFKSGNSVAVRLPKELGIPEGTELEVEQSQTGVFLRRKPKKTVGALIKALEELPKPSTPFKAERLVFPKRRGLP